MRWIPDRESARHRSMITPEKKPDWNELQFLSWTEFVQMVPAIVLLEVRRIDRLLKDVQDFDCHNRLVKARFEMKQFVASLTDAKPQSVGTSASHLRHAMLNVALEPESQDPNLVAACGAIAGRLKDILKRIELIY